MIYALLALWARKYAVILPHTLLLDGVFVFCFSSHFIADFFVSFRRSSVQHAHTESCTVFSV